MTDKPMDGEWLRRMAELEHTSGTVSVGGLAHDLGMLRAAREPDPIARTSAEEPHDVLAALFRADPAVTGQPQVTAKLRECLAIGREITALERFLGVDRELATAVSYPMPAPASKWEAIQQGQRLAEEERRRLGLGSGPLPPLMELLESQGVRAGFIELAQEVSGMTMIDPHAGLLVVANAGHHVVRQRFSFAHEYAHVLVDRARLGLVSRSSDRDDLIEVRANAFAANFLMPEAGVRQFVAALGKGKPSRVDAAVFDETGSVKVEGRSEPGSQDVQLYDVVQLAHHFGVSRQSALFHLRNLRLITEAEFEQLQSADEAGKGKQVARMLGLSEIEPGPARSDFRHRLLTLGLEAFRRMAISRSKLGELAAMIGWSRRDLDQLLDEAGIDQDAEA